MQKNIKIYTLKNFHNIPQVQSAISETEQKAIQIVGNVLPFKVNNYVTDELIDWNNIPEDPIFQLTFPQREMLSETHFADMERALCEDFDKKEIRIITNNIRYELNPNTAGQHKNVPSIDGMKLTGVQHKYRETVLFFPSSSQTCHAYCTFCFRWPQFVGIDELKYAMKESELLAEYMRRHPEATDVLFTGGDPMVMSANKFEKYIDPLINNKVPNLRTIRIGSKSLAYWPYRFLTDKDSDDLLRMFEKIVNQGYHLAFMAHFNHPREMETNAVKNAISRILSTGAKIRTQSPIMNHINKGVDIWSDMWQKQVNLGMIPYYMFVARDTGAQKYFAVSLDEAWRIYQKAYQQVSGIARTVKGPSMSADPGKVQVLGVSEVAGKKVFVLRFIQGRNSDWTCRPFFAEHDTEAVWLDDLKPAFGEKDFFYEKEMQQAN